VVVWFFLSSLEGKLRCKSLPMESEEILGEAKHNKERKRGKKVESSAQGKKGHTKPHEK